MTTVKDIASVPVTVVSETSQSIRNYERRVYRIVVDADLSEDDRTDLLVHTITKAFKQHTTVDAVVVFAFRTPEAEAAGAFDVGRIVASRDGIHGWTGDGRMMALADRDDGRAVIDLAAPLVVKNRIVRYVKLRLR